MPGAPAFLTTVFQAVCHFSRALAREISPGKTLHFPFAPSDYT